MSDDPTGNHPDSMDLPGKDVNPPPRRSYPRQHRKAGIRRVHVGALINADSDALLEQFCDQDNCSRSYILSKYIEAMIAARHAGGSEEHALAHMVNMLREEGFIQ